MFSSHEVLSLSNLSIALKQSGCTFMISVTKSTTTEPMPQIGQHSKPAGGGGGGGLDVKYRII